jgi:putative membrane protein
MTRFLLQAAAAAAGFWIAARVFHIVRVDDLGSALAAGLILGVVNALLRPILVLVTFPITVVTLGLFLLVVNGLMVSLVAFFDHGVHIRGFWHAVLVAVICGLTSWAASIVIGSADRDRLR